MCKSEPREDRTPSLLIWSQTRYHCAMDPITKRTARIVGTRMYVCMCLLFIFYVYSMYSRSYRIDLLTTIFGVEIVYCDIGVKDLWYSDSLCVVFDFLVNDRFVFVNPESEYFGNEWFKNMCRYELGICL